MICPKCGTESNGDFCVHCGDRLSYDRENSVRELIKKFASSRLLFAGLVAYILSAVLSFIYTIISKDDMMNMLYEAMWQANISASDTKILADTYISALNFSNVIAHILLFLTALGIILTLSTVKRMDKPFSAAGVSIIKIVSVVRYSMLCAAYGIIVFYLLLATALVSAFDPLIGGYFAIIIVVIGAILALSVLSLIFTVKTFNTLKTTFTKGIASDKVSSFLGVITILGGTATAVAEAVILIAAEFDLLTLVTNLSSAFAQVVFGVVLLKYKKEMRALINNR